MSKLEQVKFETKEKFMAAIEAVLSGEDKFRSYLDKEGNSKQIKLISKNRLYFGNNLSVSINQGNDGQVYCAIEFFAVEDRIRISQMNKTDFKSANEL